MSIDIPYKPFDRYIVRTPLKPFYYLQSFLSNKETNLDLIKSELRDPIIKEAIFLASPDLYKQIDDWLKGKELKKKDEERLLFSILKYLSRLSSRSTPFGLFAGISIGKINEKECLEIPDISRCKRNLRLDMNYTVALAMHLSRLPVIKNQIKFYPNTSKSKLGEQLRYVEYSYQNTKRVHHLTAVNDSEYLQIVLNKAKPGAKIADLAKALVDDEISFTDADEFINELIDNQILISELEPSVIGKDLLIQIISVIEKLNEIEMIKEQLYEIQDKIEYINKQPIGIAIKEYFKLVNIVKKFGVDFKLKYMFQVDMIKPAQNITISNNIIDNILHAFYILNRITAKIEESNLTKFRDAFYERYEDAEVPLLHALDTESGIGYINLDSGAGIPSPLIDDLNIHGRASGSSYNIKWSNYNSFILKKYIESVKEHKSEIEITDEEIDQFAIAPEWNDLSVTMASMVQLFKRNGKTEIFLKNAGGSSAVNLLGRFAHTDSALNDLVHKIADYEQEAKKDAILAEIVHLPESRTGNILLRPSIRKYEIPYLAKSSLEQKNWILPEDIMISVKRNQIILRSKKHNKIIIPHLSNAHNFSFNALPVYQFLCDMQTHNLRSGIGFNWGSLQNEFEYLPRVRYKNIILSFAEWKIKKEEIKKLVDIKDENKLYDEVQKWRNKKNLPVWVALVDGDNKLTLNLENILCIKTLLSLVKKRLNFILTEYYLNNKNAVVNNETGIYANEFIFAFKKVKS
ncbi:MAG: lantibiotic dehydratase family protein [Thiohalospira sp.]